MRIDKKRLKSIALRAKMLLEEIWVGIKRRFTGKMEIKVMTFNLRCDCGSDGRNDWRYRTGLVKEAIYGEAPDLIGFQEVTRNMLRDIRSILEKDYVILGAGRNSDYSGEGVNIAYKKDKFDLLGFSTFWLSDTPEIPGSRYGSLDQSGCPRTAVLTELILNEGGKKLFFCNTHLDHEGKKARKAGARLIIQRLEKMCKKSDSIIITGDMNARPDTGEIAEFCSRELGITDITGMDEGTFHKWGEKAADKVKIDYIFTNAKRGERKSYVAKKYQKDGVYCSDHYPVCGYIEI